MQVSLVEATGCLSAFLDIIPNKQHTWLYSAPELLKNPLMKRTCVLDVYSYAMIEYEIIARHQVFDCTNFNLIQQLIRDEEMKPDQELINKVQSNLFDESDLDICRGLESIVIKCWQTNPKDRSSIIKVKSKLEPISKSILNGPNAIAHFNNTKTWSKLKKVSLNQFDFPFQVAFQFIQSSSADFVTSNSIVKSKTVQINHFPLLQ